jgi:hypothetical protein
VGRYRKQNLESELWGGPLAEDEPPGWTSGTKASGRGYINQPNSAAKTALLGFIL